MMKVHDESDRRIKNAIEAKCKSENLLIKATHEQRRIMYENQSLLEEMQRLTEQLSASKQEMESYAEMANIERINKYKRTIEELKQQLKHQSHGKNVTNAVPMNLYRSVVVEAKQYANQVQQQRMEIHTLENQILQLEQERHQKHSRGHQRTTTTGTHWNDSHQPAPYPSILNDFFPKVVSNAQQSKSAQISSNIINGQLHPTMHSKRPRPKTPLPMKALMKNSYSISPSLEASLHHQQPQQSIKSALKKKSNNPLNPNRAESAAANASNTKVVHFNCGENVTGITKTSSNVEHPPETSTTPSSSRRHVVSSGPTPSRLNYSMPSTTPTNHMTDDRVVTTVTPNTSGNSRHTKDIQITRSQLRLSAVRAHGGRMGLQEKLRQVRRRHNVDETTSIFSPPSEKNSPSIVVPTNSISSTIKMEPTENNIVRNDTKMNVGKESTKGAAPVVATPTELESYSMKLERMRIRPRQMGK